MCVGMSLLCKISTYNLLAILYAVLLILLLSAHMLGLVPRSLIFFQEWGAIPIQNYILLLASIGVIFFLPGYFILRLIDVGCSIRSLDAFVFSFLLSYFYTPFVGLISLLFLGKISTVFYLSISFLLLICTYALGIFLKKNVKMNRRDGKVHLDLILLITIIAFFVATLAFSKDYGYIMCDIWVHQGASLSIVKYGLDAVRMPSGWLHVGLACLFGFYGFPIINSTLVINLLQIMPILAFYCMARQIFKEQSNALGSISTIFFSLFSGFGWIFALLMQTDNWNSALVHTASVAANDTLFSNLWSLPGLSPALGVGFTAFFALIYLLFCTSKSRKTVITLTLLTFITGWFVHISEVLVFIALLIMLLLCGFMSRHSLSISIASISGLFSVLMASQILPTTGLFHVGFWQSLLLLLFLSTATLLNIIFQKKSRFFKRNILDIRHNRTIYMSVTMLILFLWLFSYYLWVQIEPTLWDLRGVNSDIRFVPWYAYPIRLGIVGFFALIAMLFDLGSGGSFKENIGHISSLLILCGGLFFLGKAITIANIYFIDPNYWEICIVRYFLYAIISLIATVFFARILSFMSVRIRSILNIKRKLLIGLATSVLLSSILIIGTTSTLFSIDYWADQSRSTVSEDLNIAKVTAEESAPLRNALFVGFSPGSMYALDRLGVKRISEPMRGIIISSSNAETYYFETWFTGTNYLLYIYEFDDYVLKSNRDSFICTNVLQAFDPVYKINETLIYELPYGVPPTTESEVLLLTPTGSPYTSILNAFAQTNSSYDVALPSAFTNLYYPIIVLPYDPLDNELSQKLTKRLDEGATLIVFNVDKLGNFAEKLNLIRKDKIAPVEPIDSWKISIGEGQIKTTMQNEQTTMNVTGQTNINGWLRIDYIFQEPWNSKNAEALAFKFKSNKPVQSVRFALFDINNNYQAYTLPYTYAGEWKEFKLNFYNFTEASTSMNLSAISKIRIGINGEPNSVYDFYFSDIEIILKPNSVPSNSIAYKQQTLTLPAAINVPILNTNNATAFYMLNETKVSPLIIQENYGAGKLIYVNAFPLIDNKETSLKILPEVLKWIKDTTELPSFNWTRDNINQRFEMYTKRVTAQGSINIDSNSIMFINGFELKLQAQDYSNIHFSIKATNIEITPYTMGTYAKISFYEPFELNIFENEKLLSKYYVTNNSTLLVKDPRITVHGETQLEESFWRKKAEHWGRTLIFNGETAFTIHYPNVYLFIFDFKYNGSFRSFTVYSDLVKLYPQLEQVHTSLYLSIIVLVLIATIEKVRKTQEPKENFSNQ
ncbi:MAG: hypothetical protein QXY74_03600 [Candidatus Bathyarchaeia archaeon]